MSEVTVVLQRVQAGDTEATAELLTLIYDELRRLAAGKMSNESASQTLQPTALVHEAWLRLAGDAGPQFENRAHFFAAAAEAMRRILIERARRRLAAKRGPLGRPSGSGFPGVGHGALRRPAPRPAARTFRAPSPKLRSPFTSCMRMLSVRWTGTECSWCTIRSCPGFGARKGSRLGAPAGCRRSHRRPGGLSERAGPT